MINCRSSQRLLTGFGRLVYFTNVGLLEFQVRYLVSFLLFSEIHSFEWFWMESLHKNIQLMLEFLKAPFLGTFPTAIFLLYINDLMVLLSILSVIRHLTCSNNLNWLLSLNLIYKTLWTRARISLLISMLGKLNWFCLTSLITLVLM